MATWTDHSLLVAMQSAFGTAASSGFVALQAEVPKASFQTESETLDLMTGQSQASAERVIGRRHGSITFKLPLEGFKQGFDPTAEDPGGAPSGSVEVIPPWACLVANALGSNLSNVSTNADFWRGKHLSVSQYTSGGVASATSTEVVYDNATASDKVDVGQLVVTATSATSTSPQIGWAKAKATQTVTLFEASVNTVNSASAHAYGTATAYASSETSSVKPLTFRWVGQNSALGYILRDAICEKVVITWESGQTPTCEMTFKFYDYLADSTIGGLQVPSAYDRIPQIVGSTSGRATIAGTATCGLESCTWEWSATLRETKCHGTGSGISAVSVYKPRVKVSFSVPHDSSDAIYDAAGASATQGSHVWQSALELGTRKSLGVYVGTKVGKVFSLLIPSGLVVETPSPDVGEDVRYTVTMEAASYTGDSTDTAETSADSPIDSVARIGLG